MNKRPPIQTVLAFVESINRHDVAAMVSLMTEDHEFTDSVGDCVKGVDQLRKAWIAYFYLFPDFRIKVDQTLARGDIVGLFGTASGTYTQAGKAWQMPAAWKVSVRDDRVASWQVYADNEPVRVLMSS